MVPDRPRPGQLISVTLATLRVVLPSVRHADAERPPRCSEGFNPAGYRPGMTVTETASAKKAPPRNGNGDSSPALVDQFVLSTAGVASQSFTNFRRVIDGAVATADTIVLGLFDVAEDLARSQLVNEVAAKTVSIARQGWNTATATTREALELV
jgi:hypothetical protein